ncbi:MAG TPA: alpha/beta hydrolase [Chitinophagales bacterium]|nr:alpha/beta hydrolase [Chitinophagales bacterium]
MLKKLSYLFLITILFSSCSVLQQAAENQKKQQANKGAGGGNNGGGGGKTSGNEGNRDTYQPDGVRYRDKVFNAYDVNSEVFLTGVPTWDNKTTNLKIDIYTPQGDDQSKGRPCIIFYYGGAWASKMKQGFDVFNSELAMRGYVAISGDYRVGFKQSNVALLCIGDIETNMTEAAFRAFQDTKALIRHVRANAEKYGIDPNKIYVAGGSAGGANALGATYFEDNEVPDYIRKSIGGLESIGRYQNVSSKPNGVITLAGPLMGPPSAIEKQNVPIYLLQGQCDELIPWNYEKAFPHCKNNNKIPMVMGCNALYERLKAVGETVWFDKVCGGGHGSFEWGMVELNRRMSNFCYLVMNNEMKTGDFIFIPQKSSCPGKTFPECEKWMKK